MKVGSMSSTVEQIAINLPKLSSLDETHFTKHKWLRKLS
jgi:hypothetical protein